MSRRRVRFAGAAGSFIILVSQLASSALPPAPPPPPTCPTRLTAAQAALIAAIIDSADSVVTYRVNPHEEFIRLGEPDTARKVSRYRIISAGRTASTSDIAAIRALTLNPDAHHRHQKQCLLSPGIGIEFVRPDTNGFALICFDCSQWVFGKEEPDWIVWGDFELVREDFVRLVQRLLPEDAELESLRTTSMLPLSHLPPRSLK